MIEQLTYAQIAERLGVSPEAARAIVKRNRLPRSRANDGKTLVAVDLWMSCTPLSAALRSIPKVERRLWWRRLRSAG